MRGQGALFGTDTSSVDEAELVVSVRATLTLLQEEGVLTARHRAKAQGLLDLARDICMARPGSIAKINGFRLLHEQLTELLELEVPGMEGDDAGDRITKLSEWLKSRRVDPDTRDTPAS